MNSFHAPALLSAVRSAVQLAYECFTPFPVLLGYFLGLVAFPW